MAWIYFHELVESQSHLNHGSEQLPIVSVTHTHKAFFCHGCNQVTLTRPQFGMMSPHSVAICCPELTSSVVDSRAKTSVLQDLERVWMVTEAAFSSKSSDLQENATQASFSLKMSLQSEPVEGKEFAKNWPKSGMIVGGQLFQPPQLVPLTSVTDGSLWRTPNANDSARGPMSLHTALNGGHQISLVTQVRHPELWPTPAARDFKGMSGKGRQERKGNPKDTLPNAVGGQLNPMWVEWLMGYPIGHTELDALATAWFRLKSGKPSKSSLVSKKGASDV